MQGNQTPEKETAIPRKKAEQPGSHDLLAAIITSLEDDKAEDAIVIDLSGKSTMADYMVIASGRSQRQVGAMADHIVEKIKLPGLPSALVEGQPRCDWVLVDAGDVVVHLFRPEVRDFYKLEKLWSAPPAPAEQVAAGC